MAFPTSFVSIASNKINKRIQYECRYLFILGKASWNRASWKTKMDHIQLISGKNKVLLISIALLHGRMQWRTSVLAVPNHHNQSRAVSLKYTMFWYEGPVLKLFKMRVYVFDTSQPEQHMQNVQWLYGNTLLLRSFPAMNITQSWVWHATVTEL
jgi:hypothetical protein